MRFLTIPVVAIPLALMSSCGNTDPREEELGSDPSASDNGDSGGDSDSAVTKDDYYPLKVGAFWEYNETDLSGTSIATLTYEITGKTTDSFGTLGEREVFIQDNIVIDDSVLVDDEKRVQYISDDGVRAERLRHEVHVYDAAAGSLIYTKRRDYEPGFLRLDRSRLTVGDTWTEQLTRTSDSTPLVQSDQATSVIAETMVYEFQVIAADEVIQVPAGQFSCIKIQRYSNPEYDNETKVYWFAKGVGKVKEVDDLGTEELLSYSIP